MHGCPKVLNYVDYNGFFNLTSVYLKAIDHLNLKLMIFMRVSMGMGGGGSGIHFSLKL